MLVLGLRFLLSDSAPCSCFRTDLADLDFGVPLHLLSDGEVLQGTKLGCWLLLAPYFLQISGIFLYIIWQCMKPVLYRTRIIPDPGNLPREFQHITFRPEDFVAGEGGYPASCSICLVDFSADDTDIVVTLCSGQKHVFHRACLATWFRTTQTCPLCRTALGGAGDTDAQSALELASNEASQP